MLKTIGDPDKAPVIEAPLLGCWVYEPGKLTTAKGGKNVCVAPCPAGAKPGGACQP